MGQKFTLPMSDMKIQGFKCVKCIYIINRVSVQTNSRISWLKVHTQPTLHLLNRSALDMSIFISTQYWFIFVLSFTLSHTHSVL